MKLKNLLLLIFALFLSSLNANNLLLNNSFKNIRSHTNGINNCGNFLPAAFLPTATISGTATVCRNGVAEITFTGFNGTAPYTFTYNINNGPDITVTTTTGDSVVVTADTSVDGVFAYNLTNVAFGTNPADSQAQTGTETITVNALPEGTATGNSTVCLNAPAPNITFTGSGGTIPYTFVYNINGGTEITVTTNNTNSINISVPTDAAGTFVYNLVKVSSAGTCEQVLTKSATIKVFGVPTATVSGTATVCLNDDKPSITFTGANGEPPYTFSYNINGGTTQTTTTYLSTLDIPINTNASGTFTYNLLGVSYAGVSGCSQAQTGSATVTVNKLPTATVTPLANSVCVNATAPTVTFTGADGTGPYTFTYNVNNGANQTITTTTGNSVSVNVPTTVAGIFNYNLVSVSSGPVTACSQPQTGTAIVYVGVYAEISAPFSSICPGYAVDVTFKGTPNATINFSSSPAVGNYSVILDANGNGTYSPFVTATTTYTLTNGTSVSPACVNNLSDTAVILISTTGPCAPTPKAEIEIETPIPVCALGDCTDLTASYFQLKPTSDYQVVSVPYQNLYPYTGGTILNAPCDDAWAPTYTLPFNFCFYGTTYTQLLVGSNGVLTFDLAGPPWGAACNGLLYCPWQFSATIPTAGFPIKNAIYGVYQDTDIRVPADGGAVANPLVQNVNYYVGGVAPNRYFVANFNELPTYSCGTGAGLQTTQVILHETTNIIDIYVKKRQHCQGWQGGAGVIGVQNAAGTKATFPPGRNTGNWDTTNEAWRFLPSGPGDLVTIEWKDQNGTVVSTQNTINVCPTGPETYTVEASYTKCDNTIVMPKPSDSITIDIEPALPVLDPVDIFMCTNVEPFHFNINQDTYILNGSSAANYEILYYEDEQSAKDYGGNDIFTTYGTINDYVVATAAALPKTLWVRITDLTSGTGCANIRSFVIDAGQPAGSISYPDYTYLVGGDPVPVIASTDLTPGGVFTAAPVDPAATPPQIITIDPATGVIDLGNTTQGDYVITYTVAATAYCPEYVVSTTPNLFRVIKDTACTVNVTNDFAICQGTTFNLTATVAPDDITPTFEWSGPEGFTSTVQNPFNVPSPSVAGVYTYTVIKKTDGVECATDSVVVTVYELPSAAFVTPSSSICTNASTTINFTGSANASVTFNVSDTNGANSNVVVQLDATGNFAYPATLQYDTTYELVKVESNTTPVCSVPFPPGTEITITVGLPDATVSIVNSVICSGDSAIFDINGNPGATVDYTDGTTPGTTILDTAGTAQVTLTGLTANKTLTLTNITSSSTPSCSKTLNVSASVTVNPLPVVNTFTAAVNPICSGTTASLLVNGTPNATVTYTDSNNNTYPSVLLDASGNGSFTTPVLAASETFTLINITSSGTFQCMQATTLSVTINITQLPAITTQPSGALVCDGDPVTFTVVASGTNLHYQWVFTDSLNVASNVGTDQSSYTIPAPTIADVGNYSVTVTNNCGVVTSQPANLAVNQPTVITLQPLGDTLCEGNPITINVTATGVNLQYQWFKDLPTNPLAGQTNPTLSITPATLADGGTYFCEISNQCQTVLSNNAVVVVNELIAIDSHPTAVTLCEGESFTLSVVASGTNPTYQWNNSNGPIPGAVNADYTVTSAQNVPDDSDYHVIVSGTCAPPVNSNTVHVTVNKQPVIVNQPIGVTACEGDTVTLSLIATGTNLVYQWQQNGFNVAGATSNILTIPVSALTDAGTYICFVSNSVSSCPPVSSNPAEVVINVAPAIVTQPVSRIVCFGDTVNFTVEATGNNLSYQWFYNNAPIPTNGTANSYTIPVAQLSDSGNYKVVVSSPSCPSVTSSAAYLIVNPLPEATISNGLESVICNGNAADVIFSGTPNAIVTYTINGGEVKTIILSPSGSAILPTGVLEETATYELVSVATNDTPVCTKSLSGEPNSVVVVTVNVIPDPKLDQDGFICTDALTGVTLADSHYLLDTGLDIATYSFEWYLDDVLITVPNPPYNVAVDQPYYDTTLAGIYKVIVTDRTTGCTLSATAPITTSSPPVSITATVETAYFDENATIVVTVDPPGVYEYRIDDGPYQESNVFIGVRTLINFDESGYHTVYARDLKACDEVSYSLPVIDYPKYFTPNGDGYHDYWNITTLKNMPETRIFIFDRFGKLLKEISSTSLGWDGTFNGHPMIADDYWFVVKYNEQGIKKEFKAHFAIKR
ncbi:MAG: T9SS type B sorting domain-containing protein [Flavobacterium sp.]|nr:T9SS type B sorting domain-containing protein [Flavobacterium sp.]